MDQPDDKVRGEVFMDLAGIDLRSWIPDILRGQQVDELSRLLIVLMDNIHLVIQFLPQKSIKNVQLLLDIVDQTLLVQNNPNAYMLHQLKNLIKITRNSTPQNIHLLVQDLFQILLIHVLGNIIRDFLAFVDVDDLPCQFPDLAGVLIHSLTSLVPDGLLGREFVVLVLCVLDVG